MPRLDVSKFVFWSLLVGGVLGSIFVLGVYSGARENAAYRLITGLKSWIETSVNVLLYEAPNLTGRRPVWYLQHAHHEGSGVTLNETADDHRVLLAGFFEGGNQIRLIARDGTVLVRWPVEFSTIFPDASHSQSPPATDWNVDLHGTVILPDGSIVFNFEYLGLAKLDRCGNLVWKVARETHHSVERAEGGGFWVPSRRHVFSEDVPRFPPFRRPYIEDTILRVSDDGEILREISLVDVFYQSGLEALLTANGEGIRSGWVWDREIAHLNKVGELKSDMAGEFPGFSAGDLILSIRMLNMILVIDPNTESIKWWHIGPWVRQHDPEFEKGGTIAVFNNNTYRMAFGYDVNVFSRVPADTPRVSNIVRFRPANGEHSIVFGGKPGEELLSVIRGKLEPTAAGGWFITEHEAGRALEVSAGGEIIWEYVNRYDEQDVAEITEARLYPADYFEAADWSCPRSF